MAAEGDVLEIRPRRGRDTEAARRVLHPPARRRQADGAFRVSTTLSVIGAVVAEFVAAERGLGYLIFFSTSFFKVPQAFAALGLLVALSLLLFHAVGLAQHLLFPWSLRA